MAASPKPSSARARAKGRACTTSWLATITLTTSPAPNVPTSLRNGRSVIPASGANALSVAEYVVTAALMLLRGAYYEGWHPAATPTRERHLVDFIEHVAAELPRAGEIEAGAAARASFAVMARCLDRAADAD